MAFRKWARRATTRHRTKVVDVTIVVFSLYGLYNKSVVRVRHATVEF